MENSQSKNSNSRRQSKNRYHGSSEDFYRNYEQELDGINYDYDWNTEYGDGDIPDIDHPK